MMDDRATELILIAAAIEISGLSAEEAGALFVDRLAGSTLSTLFRATGEKSARGLFVALARQKRLAVDDDGFQGLSDAAKRFFHVLAGLMNGLVARAPPEDAADAPVRVVKHRPKPRDLIFERAGKQRFDRTLADDVLPEGHPTSTAQVMVEYAASRAAGDDPLAAKMRALGLTPPMSPAEDAEAFRRDVEGRLEAELGPAPETAAVPMRVAAYLDGRKVTGQVFISKPQFGAGDLPPATPAPAAGKTPGFDPGTPAASPPKPRRPRGKPKEKSDANP